MMRRARLALAALAFGMTTPVAAQTVTVENGTLSGKALPSGVNGWFGVPFAKPPVRDLRWRAPQLAQDWVGTYHADRFAPMCLQAMRSRTMNHYFGNEAISEDCLYLNIWAPKSALRSKKKLPVIVWIYGGGFNVGSASMANYAGENLSKDGVVYVTIAYRVGPMGFLAHPDLTKEGGGRSGNYGLMDQVAALEWVQRNIGAFGGDKGNVTIMGQSAGSMSVSLLQINPRAKGLFHKIVAMSGSVHGDTMGPVPLADGEAAGLALQNKLGAGGIEEMRDMPGDRILAAASANPSRAIVIDSANVTGNGAQVFSERRHIDVPVMMGFTRDERFVNLGPASSVAEYETVIRATFGDRVDAILAAYPAASDAEVMRALTDVMRDMSVGRQMFNWASNSAQFGSAPVYAYFFTRRQPYADGISFVDHDPATVGAYHTGEVPYFLRTLDSLNLFRTTRNWEAGDYALSDRMSGAILNFARTGVPSPNWPRFTPHSPQVLQFGESDSVMAWPNWRSLNLLTPSEVLTPKSNAAPNRSRD